VEAPLVVSSVDVRRTFGQLLDAGLFDPEFLHATDHVRMRSPSVRLHLALRGLPSFSSGGVALDQEALGGNIVLASEVASVERAYDAAKHGGWAQRPAIQMQVPTLHDASLAPPGQHVLSIHAQYAAYNQREGWSPALRMAVEQAVMDGVRQVAPDIDQFVVGRRLLTPPDVEAEFHVAEGSALHGELALDQFLFMRPVPACSRYATPLPGLWVCGSSTHPGAGTAAVSGWLAAREILRRKDKS
jgi:phytoene dehydrogenase-like protein